MTQLQRYENEMEKITKLKKNFSSQEILAEKLTQEEVKQIIWNYADTEETQGTFDRILNDYIEMLTDNILQLQAEENAFCDNTGYCCGTSCKYYSKCNG